MSSTRKRRGLRRAIIVAAALALALAAGAYHQWVRSTVSLTSSPAGADVRIDGNPVGRTPLSGHALSPGLHRIELRHSHYALHSRQLALEAGDHVDLHVELEGGLGRLRVFTNPRGAWVEVDGRRQRGVTPVLLTLPSGPHELAMGMAERRAVTEHVVVTADLERELRVDLNIDPHGSLWVEVVPEDARVEIGSGGPDYEPGVRLPIGEYPIRVTRHGYSPRTVRLEVRYGDNHHRVALERAFARLAVRTEPAESFVKVRFREHADAPLRWHDYVPEMQLPVGPVDVRARSMDRKSAFRHIELPPTGATLALALPAIDVQPGERIRDPLRAGGRAPEMVVVPSGRFVIGSTSGPPSTRPPRQIALTEPFAVSVTEVTAADYRRFARATGQKLDHRLEQAPDDHPATHVDFTDAVAYAEWLTEESGHRYRLPSEAEWEYFARAGSEDAYFFGDDAQELCRYANVADDAMDRRYEGYDMADCDDGFVHLAPVASFPPNPFGLHDVHGNAAEWVQECGLPAYAGLAEDGSPQDASIDCPTHGVRGGGWDGGVSEAASGHRGLASSASADRGIRLVREL